MGGPVPPIFFIIAAMQFIRDLLHLFYPELCIACGSALQEDEKYVCLACRFALPRTHFHKHKDNPAERVFWGRVPLHSAASFLLFTKQSRVQQLMHHIKYKGIKEAAALLGEWYGSELAGHERFQADYILPVPLHAARLRERGFNQSEWFAMGLSRSMNIPVDTQGLKRIHKSESQTRKGRFKRWENVKDIFSCAENYFTDGQHLLLVDDVITTGATLEACAQTILSVNCNLKISIATLAFASH